MCGPRSPAEVRILSGWVRHKPQARGVCEARKRSSWRFGALKCSVRSPVQEGGVDLASLCRGVTLWACPAL